MNSDLEVFINLSDRGTAKALTKDTDKYNDSLEKTSRITDKLNRAKKAAYQADDSGEGRDYGKARAAVGTGAAGRDFAKQASGLGGLVHVYATFAANLFAVSAAFTALSNAADTSNMVKGLEQLGAASGTNLNQLSKQLVDATDGAISLKDAMKATAQASAAGMSSENIKKLGIAAKQAGLALGIDASDAISRLSRGITKLEPELLDELGIFTKLDKATTDYARELGKPVSALTDFEKRQGFANAVLDEANKKFGDIKIESNPYSKLLASLKDAAQTMLEVVNSYLGPVLKALSQSPTALMLGITGIAGVLLKQAIPALSSWRQGLHDAAEASAAASSRTKELFDLYVQSSKDQAMSRLPDTVKSFGESAKAGMDAARAQLKEGARLYNKDFNSMMKLDVSEITSEHQKVIDATRAKLTAAASKAASSGTPEQATAAQARLDTFNKVAASMIMVMEAQEKYNEGIKKIVPHLGTMADIHGRIAAQTDLASKKYNILATAVDNTTFVGPILAFKSLRASIQAMGDSISWLGSKWLLFKGTMAIGMASIGMITAAFGNVMSIIGLVVGAMSMLTVAFGKNGDEAERSRASLDALKSDGDSLVRTFERLEKLNPLEKLSPSNAAAATNAIAGVSESISKAISDTEKTVAARGGVDVFTNWLAGAVGKSDEDLLAKRINKELSTALDAAASNPVTSGMKSDLAKLLGLDSAASTDAITEAFAQQGEAGAKMLATLAKKYNTASQSVKTWNDGLKDTTKLFRDMENEMIPTDKMSVAITKVAKDFIDFGNIVDEDGVGKISAMIEISKSAEMLSILPKDIRDEIIATGSQVEDLGKQIADNTAKYTAASNAVEVYNQKIKEQKELIAKNSSSARIERLQALESGQATAKEVARGFLEELNKNKDQIKGLTDIYAKASEAGFQKSSDSIGKIVTDAIAKGSIALEQAALSKGTRTKETIDRQNDLANKQIDLDLDTQRTQLDLVIETKLLRLEMENRRISETKAADAAKQGLTGQAKDTFMATPTVREKQIAAITNALSTEGGNRYKSVTAEDLQKQGISKGEAIETAQMKASYAVKAEAANAQKSINNLTAAIDKVNFQFDKEGKKLADEAQGVTAALSTLQKTKGASLELRNSAEYRAQEDALLAQQAKLEKDVSEQIAKKSKAIDDEIARRVKLGEVITQSKAAEIKADATIAENQLKRKLDASSLEITQRRINDAYAYNEDQLQKAEALSKQKLANDQFSIDKDKQSLDLLMQLGKLSEDQIMNAQRSLAIRQAERDNQEQVVALAGEYQRKLDAITKERETALGTSDSLSAADEKAFDDRIKALAAYYDEEAKRIARSKELRLAAADAITAQTSREIAYTGLVKQGFKGMEDAIVEFTKTGKLSFSSMIDSFIEGLLRYEIQQQQFAMFSALGGASGIGKYMASFFGSTGTAPADINMSNMYTPAYVTNAKGGAYDAGIKAFAQGGMFTNSIVSSPTLFKFAQGTGLMGEAGPEAIMPLKRDSSGNLGVRTNQSAPTTNVVVNNYSTAQATTKETVDSRGNRSIEVMIGDAVASQLGKPGSTVQQSFSHNFGAKPAVARR